MGAAYSSKVPPFVPPTNAVTHEFIQQWLSHPVRTTVLIHTLPLSEQQCLLPGTLTADQETDCINRWLQGGRNEPLEIVVYGKHASDPSVYAKVLQLQRLRIPTVWIYIGGMFEWILLQEVYGTELCPTTGICNDPLSFLPPTSSKPR